MRKNVSFLLLTTMLTSCVVPTKDNVCESYIDSYVVIRNFQKIGNNNNANLTLLNINGHVIKTFKHTHILNKDNYLTIDFDTQKENIITENNAYKIQYNDDIYFIYNIKLANNPNIRYCYDETTYNVNDCKSNGTFINIEPSCAIPAEQADEYFEQYVKPTLNP